jgi:hypothetical protein
MYICYSQIDTIWSMKELGHKMSHDELPKDVVQNMVSNQIVPYWE